MVSRALMVLRHASGDESTALDELEGQLRDVRIRHSGPIVLAGDININTRSDTVSNTRLCQPLHTYSLQQHIAGPSFRSVKRLSNGSLTTYQISAQAVQPFPRYEKGMRT